MKDGRIDSIRASDLLRPRKNLPWKAKNDVPHYWLRPFWVDNKVARAHVEALLADESRERFILRDTIDGELAGLSAVNRRFWIAEYMFLEKLMTFRQLAIYSPAFLSLSRIMPNKLVFCRRLVVRKYLDQHSLPSTAFVSRLCGQFVRSSVLLYPAEKLTVAADRFICMVLRSADQSKEANSHRIAMMLRSLHLMSDHEICDRFQYEEAYLNELTLLAALSRHYRLNAEDIFRISAKELNKFWEASC